MQPCVGAYKCHLFPTVVLQSKSWPLLFHFYFFCLCNCWSEHRWYVNHQLSLQTCSLFFQTLTFCRLPKSLFPHSNFHVAVQGLPSHVQFRSYRISICCLDLKDATPVMSTLVSLSGFLMSSSCLQSSFIRHNCNICSWNSW